MLLGPVSLLTGRVAVSVRERQSTTSHQANAESGVSDTARLHPTHQLNALLSAETAGFLQCQHFNPTIACIGNAKIVSGPISIAEGGGRRQ